MLEKLIDKAKTLNASDLVSVLSNSNIFFELNIDEALELLRKLEIKENALLSTYLELISIENYEVSDEIS